MAVKLPGKEGGLIKSSGGIAAFTILTAITGLLIDVLLAARFGLGTETDAFYAAYTVPFFIANTAFVLGQATLVPMFSRYMHYDDKDSAARFLGTYMNLALLVGAALSALAAVFSPEVISVIAPGMFGAPAELAASLSAALAMLMTFALMSEVLRSFLYSKRLFVFAASSNFIRNTAVIVSLILFYRRYGIMSAAYGFTAGYGLQFAALAVRVYMGTKVYYRFVMDLKAYGLADTVRIGLVQGGGFTVLQSVTFAERIIGSYLPAGSITALSYASRIIFMAVETLAGSIATATLPDLSRALSIDDREKTREILSSTFRVVLLLFLPLTALVVLLRVPIIEVLYQRGAFTRDAVLVTSLVFMLYGLSLVFQGYNRLIHNYLFASLKPRGSLMLFTVLASVTIVLDLALVGPLGISAMPVGYLIGSGTAFLVGSRVFVVRYSVLTGNDFRGFAARSALLALLFGGACYIIFILFRDVALPESRWATLTALSVSIALASVLTVLLGLAVRLKELDGLRSYVRSRYRI